MDLKKALSIEDLRVIARQRVPRFVFDYVDGGSEGEVTLLANRESFERLRFRPRTLVDVSQRNLHTTILGGPSSLPVIAGPLGLLGLSRRHGDMEMGRAAAAAGVPYGVSTVSMDSLEDISREAGGRLWFQCYVFR
jgi:(S)-mandelate dehydrogenase